MTSMNAEIAADLLRRMVLIRRFEERVGELFADGELPGFVHLYIGQEAIASGVCASLDDGDWITSTHRGHGHLLAKGGDPARMMAELYGKKEGYCRGKGGSMHIADPTLGILGANGIVAAGIPIAAGAAFAAKQRRDGAVAVAFFGDGATGEGNFHETLNLATVMNLPMLFVCENNRWAVSTSASRARKNQRIADFAAAYDIHGASVDGNDAGAVFAAAEEAIARAREGGGPTLLECETYRMRMHFEGEPDTYRQADEVKQWGALDPVVRWQQRMVEADYATTEMIESIDADAQEKIAAAVEFGRAGELPGPEAALEHVYA
jgi:acetoin:2,6-dichlorophenolindophenol oxidoreductase subunit alpha